MTTQTDPEIAAVEALLRKASQDAAQVPPSLTARVLADARAVQTGPQDVLVNTGGTLLDHLRAALGEWRGMGGLAAATCAGFWIGVSPPAGLPDAADWLRGTDAVEQWQTGGSYGGFGWDVEEG